MVKRIITISREFGSGVCVLSEKKSLEEAGAYYDKNVINEITQKSPDYRQNTFRKMQNYLPKKGMFAYALAGL